MSQNPIEIPPYLVTGRSDTQATYPRREVRAVQATSPEQWALLNVAFWVIAGNKAPSPFPDAGTVPPPASWIQIGGIHGLPFQKWLGDPPGPNNDGDFQDNTGEPDQANWGGYCNHGAILFPTWHRPYVMLVEQSLGDVATKVAAGIQKSGAPDAAAWIQAAKELRLPYWDWTDPRTGSEGVPAVFTDNNVIVKTPAGSSSPTSTFPNPLKSFNFQGNWPSDFYSPYKDVWPRTLRYPTSDDKNATDNYKDMNDTVKNYYSTVNGKVGGLFTAPSPNLVPPNQWAWAFDQFASTNPVTKFQAFGSIEDPHNDMHVYIGGGSPQGTSGHMSDPAYAGFDPIFFFHHCNVDRIIYQWMTVYPEYWLGNGYDPGNGSIKSFVQLGATYNNPDKGSTNEYDVNQSSGLPPFRIANGDYWNSLNAKEYNTLWYNYSTKEAKEPSNSEERDTIRAHLQRKGGLNPLAESEHLGKSTSPIFHGSPNVAVPEGHSQIKHYRHFVVDVALVEHAFSGSYSLSLEVIKGQILGSVSVFTRRDLAGCPSCRARHDTKRIVNGVITIPATTVLQLLRNKKLENEEGNKAIEKLKEHLTAKIVLPNRSVIAEVATGRSNEFPEILAEEALPKVTLRSAKAAHPQGWDKGPVVFFDWEEHGSIFVGNRKWYEKENP